MENNATEANEQAIAPAEEIKVLTPTDEDLEAKYAALEADKARLIEEASNYKVAYLKEKSRNKESFEDETEEDRLRRITREEISNSRLSEINRERDAVLSKALKENKELKLAQLNKNSTPPAAMGSHSEGQTVKDTLVTPEQLAAFKARNWDDKRIDNYKKNLRKYGGR